MCVSPPLSIACTKQYQYDSHASIPPRYPTSYAITKIYSFTNNTTTTIHSYSTTTYITTPLPITPPISIAHTPVLPPPRHIPPVLPPRHVPPVLPPSILAPPPC